MAKTVLITGALAGIGRATAIYLAQNVRVYGAARRIDKMQDLETYQIKTIALDVTNDDQMAACVEQVYREAGSIDILINSAGLGSYGALEDVLVKDAKNQMDINLFGTARMIQLVLPKMREKRFGKIVHISSVFGKVHLPMGSWYHASKFAIEGLNDCLRVEVKQFGIDVNVIEPGGTKSDMVGKGTTDLIRTSRKTAYANLAKGIEKMYSSMKSVEPIVIAKLI